jgi:hypothetical protein
MARPTVPGALAALRPGGATPWAAVLQAVMAQEQAFQAWYAQVAEQYGLHPNPDHPEHYYDWRAAFRAQAMPTEEGHWPSQFKTAGHPNLVIEGIDTRTGQPVPLTPPPERGPARGPMERLIPPILSDIEPLAKQYPRWQFGPFQAGDLITPAARQQYEHLFDIPPEVFEQQQGDGEPG